MSSFQGCTSGTTVFASWLSPEVFPEVSLWEEQVNHTEQTASFQQWWDIGVNDAVSMATAALGSWPLWQKFNQHFVLAISLLTTPHTHRPLPFYLTLSHSLAQCPLLYSRLSEWCIMCLEQNNLNYWFVPMQTEWFYAVWNNKFTL